ncbi:hypothetical protein BH20VER1_BH20VER1_12440 [soil metagenome]
MSTITAILEADADADGTLHLPLPADAPRGKLRVTATVESAGRTGPNAASARWQRSGGSRRGGGIRSIPDPVAWQREQRQDRPLPGREE